VNDSLLIHKPDHGAESDLQHASESYVRNHACSIVRSVVAPPESHPISESSPVIHHRAPRHLFAACLLAASLAAPLSFGQPAATAPHAAPTQELEPLIAKYRQHLTTLSNPFFEGRAPGTKGNRVAADYIEFQLRRLGLQPAFSTEIRNDHDEVTSTTPRSNFRQVFTAPPSQRPGDSTKVTHEEVSYQVHAGDAPTTLKAGTDFSVIGYSGSGHLTGDLVFAGYATRNEDKQYDTFFGEPKLDGKIAIVLRFEPMDAKGHSLWAESGWSPASALDSKLRAVERAGAAGIILVNPPGADDDRIHRLEGLELSGSRGNGNKIPVVMMSIDAADRLVHAADAKGRSLRELREAADSLKQETEGIVPLPHAKLTLNVAVERVPLLTDNVGAILPGKGALADEFIVIGSHYDHVGYGYFGSRDPNPKGKLHPGADDNGSGTSGNLLTASRLVEAYEKLPEGAQARSILFLWFSAEESGLIGSKFYVKHPIVPIEKHALMLNMDMIGRLREGKMELGGIGTAEGFEEWLKPYIDGSGLKIKATRSGYGPSDHASFTGVQVPTLFFFTQLHKEYHTPADTIDTINFEGAVQVADLCYRIALDAAVRPQGFKFANGDAKPEQPKAEAKADGKNDGEKKDDAPQAPPGRAGVSVRFGIAPGDYSGEEPGVLIGEVMPDLPAAKAGLKEGDVMLKWNDTELKDVGSWMPLLTKAKPGDVVTIVYRRKVDGQMKEFTTKATLVASVRRSPQ
jgi:Peptidase family M28/PDZ domain/PA domain